MHFALPLERKIAVFFKSLEGALSCRKSFNDSIYRRTKGDDYGLGSKHAERKLKPRQVRNLPGHRFGAKEGFDFSRDASDSSCPATGTDTPGI